MKKLHITILILFISILLNAQNNSIEDVEITLKVRPVKSFENQEFCKTANDRSDAVVVEFDVINESDIKKFGSKIYAIAICDENPSDGISNLNLTCDLKISEIQYYCWNIKIFREHLLDKNLNKKKYWIRDLTRKIIKGSCQMN